MKNAFYTKNFPSTVLLILFISCAPTPSTTPLSESELYKKTVPAIVIVYSYNQNGELTGNGTGFILSSNGALATNYHVIEGASSLKVGFSSREKYDDVEIIATDEDKDLAILKIKGFDLPIVRLGNSNNVTIGEKVIAIGNPLGLINTLTSGIISANGIRDDIADFPVIQTTTPISPGNSGGPLLNMKGEVIGITTWRRIGGENLNFAVPINYLIALNNEGEIPSPQITVSTEDLKLKKELADKYWNEEDYYEAAKLFYEITEIDSTDPGIYWRLGYSLHRIAVNLGPHNENNPDWQEYASLAIENFTKVIKLDPEHEWGYMKIARVYGLWMIDAIQNKKPANFREALKLAQQSGGFFPFVLESNRAVLTSCSENSILFTNGDDDTFPSWYLQEIEKVRDDVIIVNLSLLNSPFYVKYLKDFKGLDFNLTDDEIDEIEPRHWPRPRNEIIHLNNYDSSYFHIKNLRLTINHSFVYDNEVDKLTVSDQLVLKLIKNYINTKDIYFGSGITWSEHSVPFALFNYTTREGLVYKIVTQPIEKKLSFDHWENNLLNKFRYSVFTDPRIFGINASYGFIQNYRNSFNALANVYKIQDDREKVKEILSFKDNVIPRENIPIPWEDLKEIYKDGATIDLYDYAGLTFREIDELDEGWDNLIATSWEPAAIDSPEYYYEIGRHYYDHNDYSKSQKYIQEYLKYNPTDVISKKIMMYINFDKKYYREALSTAKDLLENDQEDINLNYIVGNHYSKKKDYQNAKKYFEKILIVDDNDYDTFNSLGLLYLYQNNYEDALINFVKVLEYAPSYATSRMSALENIAETYKAMGENKKSIDAFIRLIETNPSKSLSFSKLAILYDIDNNEALSTDLIEIAKETMWEDNYGQIGLACYYSHKGDLKTSLSYLETAIETGFTDFSWLEFDPDLEAVRNTDDFWRLIKQ